MKYLLGPEYGKIGNVKSQRPNNSGMDTKQGRRRIRRLIENEPCKVRGKRRRRRGKKEEGNNTTTTRKRGRDWEKERSKNKRRERTSSISPLSFSGLAFSFPSSSSHSCLLLASWLGSPYHGTTEEANLIPLSFPSYPCVTLLQLLPCCCTFVVAVEVVQC